VYNSHIIIIIVFFRVPFSIVFLCLSAALFSFSVLFLCQSKANSADNRNTFFVNEKKKKRLVVVCTWLKQQNSVDLYTFFRLSVIYHHLSDWRKCKYTNLSCLIFQKWNNKKNLSFYWRWKMRCRSFIYTYQKRERGRENMHIDFYTNIYALGTDQQE
jgi:hypothetical protein